MFQDNQEASVAGMESTKGRVVGFKFREMKRIQLPKKKENTYRYILPVR